MTGWHTSSHDDVLISTRAAALLHDVTKPTIRTWVHRGLLTPTHRDDNGMWFLPQDVDRAEWAARQRDTTGRAQQRCNP
jgi:DNA-binding transcriptional MerR regulator